MEIKKADIGETVNGYSFESWIYLESEIYLLNEGSNLNHAIETTVKYWNVDHETAKKELNKAINNFLPTSPP